MNTLPPSSSARLFLALWPATPVRNALAQHRDTWRWNTDSAPVSTQNLHLTLHFIGNVERQRLPELQAGLAVTFEPFDLSFGQAELWPHGIAVLRPTTIPPALAALHAAQRERLLALGIGLEEREYRPHVTLARRAYTAEASTLPTSIRWHVNTYALLESPPGADYRVLQRYASSAV